MLPEFNLKALAILVVIVVIFFAFRRTSKLKRKNELLHGRLYDLFEASWKNLQSVLESIAKEIDSDLQVISSNKDKEWSWTIEQRGVPKVKFFATLDEPLLVMWHFYDVNGNIFFIRSFGFGTLQSGYDDLKKKIADYIRNGSV
jgi:hypothetical protein